VGVFLAEEEKNRLRQEKQALKKQLEEVKKRILWEDPVMVTEHAWALGSAGSGHEPGWGGRRPCSWALRDGWDSSGYQAAPLPGPEDGP